MALASDLVDEIEKEVSLAPGTVLVDGTELQDLTGAVAQQYVTDPEATHWWASLQLSGTSIEYQDGDMGALLRCLAGDQSALLVITDESPPPWLGIRGTVGQLSALIGELRFCEFFLTSLGQEWVIFDTHHNRLIVAGSLKKRAQEIATEGVA